MGQTVYVDLLFLINFSMDFLCFYLSAKILGGKLPTIRAILASAIGGVYSDIALFIDVGMISSLFIDFFVCVLMCAIVFMKKGRISSLPLYILVYFAVSMALGGFMTAIFNLLNRADLPIEEGGATDGISVWVFALLAAISALITLIGGRAFRKRSSIKTAEVEITYRGKTVRLDGMTDSGNLLREPISGKSCIIADVSAIERIMPREMINAAREKDASAIERLSPEDARNMRIIPIKTAGGEGILFAFRAERVTVDSGRGPDIADALIALSDIKSGADGKEALIPPELIV